MNETCKKCGAVFEPHHHFVRCDAKPCPMISTKEPRTLLEQFRDADIPQRKKFLVAQINALQVAALAHLVRAQKAETELAATA
jgi:hypothetical protein